MKFLEIKAVLKKSLNGSPQEFIDLIEAHAFPLKTHPSFTINLCHKVWTKAFYDPCWTQVVHKMGMLGLRTSNPFMWVKRSVDNGKHDLACVTHQFANYNTVQDKNMATLSLALYAKSSFLLTALISTPVDLSYTFEYVPWSKRGDIHISNHNIEGKTLAYNLMMEAPLTIVYDIMRRNNYTPTSKEWGAVVSSYRMNKHPILSFDELAVFLLLDNNNGEFALQSMITENTHRWATNSSPEEALKQIPHSNPHLKHLPEVMEYLRSLKMKAQIEQHINSSSGVTLIKRKI